MKTLVVDVDNVLRDIISTTANIYNRKYGTNFKKEDVQTYHLKDTFPNMVTDLEYYTKYPEEILFKAPLEEKHTVLNMNSLKDQYKIILATYQLRGFEKYTLYWLDKQGIKYDDICFIKDKYRVKGDVFIDDKLENLEAYQDENPKSTVVAYSQPWNKSWLGYSVENLMVLNNFLIIQQHLGERRFRKWYYQDDKYKLIGGKTK